MTVIDPGHYYQLRRLDAPKGSDLYLRFVSRVGSNYPGNKTAYPGTTLQEVYRACINRTIHLDNQKKHWTNRVVIWASILCVYMLEWRAASRHNRPRPSMHDSVWGDMCSKCLHVGCNGSCH